jgi:hypothetical protein
MVNFFGKGFSYTSAVPGDKQEEPKNPSNPLILLKGADVQLSSRLIALGMDADFNHLRDVLAEHKIGQRRNYLMHVMIPSIQATCLSFWEFLYGREATPPKTTVIFPWNNGNCAHNDGSCPPCDLVIFLNAPAAEINRLLDMAAFL